jgi:hypothetical protein
MAKDLKAGAASALFNMMRNIGGSIGSSDFANGEVAEQQPFGRQ